MKTKVKVKRAELLKIVDGRLRKAEKDYERAKAKFPEREEAWRAGVIAKLEKALTNAERGQMPSENGYDGTRLHFSGRPAKPSEGSELCQLRRMATTLRIGAEDTILLSQEDADYYFGPCRL